MTPRILLVEDTPDIALWLGTALRQGGMVVEFATDGHAADLAEKTPAIDIAVAVLLEQLLVTMMRVHGAVNAYKREPTAA